MRKQMCKCTSWEFDSFCESHSLCQSHAQQIDYLQTLEPFLPTAVLSEASG